MRRSKNFWILSQMSETGIEPTYIGKNENLKFVVPQKLFTMRIKPTEEVDPDITKLYNRYLQETLVGFQGIEKQNIVMKKI
jgi:hypothetical protein